jgi:Domain of unknown function (DUF5664)
MDNIVGDVTSNARGSGARFNSGKPQLELIPLTFIADSFDLIFSSNPDVKTTYDMLRFSGMFQATGDVEHLNDALRVGKSHWADCAKVFSYGALKYAEWNWVKGMQWSVPLGCIGRHSLAVLTGERVDQESGLSHIGHIMCNLVMLKAYTTGYPEGDNLPPKNFSIAPASKD